jgi:diaminohydroxyphosphoribosylaminopyrimidine deaminase/5-amino-6-(5-phosphoribosylamino)uracil reductase
MDEAREMLDLAARLAMRAAGHVEPNPLVGAVIVRPPRSAGEPAPDRIIGRGHHRVYGGLHAEAEALADCATHGNDPRGATLYVTLEPCNHHGKQPPCTDAIIAAGLARVVYARRDPNAAAAGGEERLRAAGIDCQLNESSQLATRLSDPFVKRITTGLPWVIAKWAQTIDGWIATRSGESKWISGPAARARVHSLRSRVDAVVTAIGTVLSDDPLLTARTGHPPRRVARRVVIDPQLEIPLESRLVSTIAAGPVLVATTQAALVRRGATARRLSDQGVDVIASVSDGPIPVADLLRYLVDQYDATNVLVEAGAGLLGRLFASDLVDEAMVFIAPKLLGDDEAVPVARGRSLERLSDASQFRLGRVRQLGDDVMLRYFRQRGVAQAHRGEREEPRTETKAT